jgi:hypothetical protein
VFYLGFKVYPLHCVLATQARVCGPGRTGRTEPTRIRIRGIQATGLLIYSYKEQYNAKYRLISLKVSNKVYLRLYKGYNLPGYLNLKLLKQRIRLFKII